MSFELFLKQTTATTVVLYTDGTPPQDPVEIQQYSPALKKFVAVGTVTDFTLTNGLEVTDLLAGTTYEWIGVDTVLETLSNTIVHLIQPITPTVSFGAQITKTEDPEIPEYTVNIKIMNASGITDKVIVMHRGIDGTDTFYCVASPTQISEFAEDAPTSPSNFFRVNNAILTFDDLLRARTFVTRVKLDLDYIAVRWADMLEFNFSSEVNTYP